MGFKRPPQHRVDAIPVFVHEADDAWDKQRIDAERKALPEGKVHPYDAYTAGETRFDLYAKTGPDGQSAADYLDIGKAWRHILRRMSPAEFAEVQSLRDIATRNKVSALQAHERGASCSWVKCEGPDAPKSLEEIHRDFPAQVWDIGSAAYIASVPLTEAEKKA